MAQITWSDKVDGAAPPVGVVTAADMNQIKAGNNSKLAYQVSATYAAIGASTEPRLIEVTADETNNGDTSLYRHNGNSIKLLMTLS